MGNKSIEQTALYCSLDILAHEMRAGIYRDDGAELIEKAARWIESPRLTSPSVEEVTLRKYREAVLALLNADHQDHFAARMSDSELAAIETMKSLVAWEEFTKH